VSLPAGGPEPGHTLRLGGRVFRVFLLLHTQHAYNSHTQHALALPSFPFSAADRWAANARVAQDYGPGVLASSIRLGPNNRVMGIDAVDDDGVQIKPKVSVETAARRGVRLRWQGGTGAGPAFWRPSLWAGAAGSEAGRRPLLGRAGREAGCLQPVVLFFLHARAPFALRPALTRFPPPPHTRPPHPPRTPASTVRQHLHAGLLAGVSYPPDHTPLSLFRSNAC